MITCEAQIPSSSILNFVSLLSLLWILKYLVEVWPSWEKLLLAHLQVLLYFYRSKGNWPWQLCLWHISGCYLILVNKYHKMAMIFTQFIFKNVILNFNVSFSVTNFTPMSPKWTRNKWVCMILLNLKTMHTFVE